jgi:hypothetical protein
MHMESAMITSTVSQFESPSPKEMQGVAKRRFKGAGVGRRPTRRDNQRESDFELRDGLITQRWMRAVRSVQDGESPEVVASVLGINRSTIYGWLAQYRRGGWGALKGEQGTGPGAARTRPRLRAAGWHHRRASWMD